MKKKKIKIYITIRNYFERKPKSRTNQIFIGFKIVQCIGNSMFRGNLHISFLILMGLKAEEKKTETEKDARTNTAL